MLSAAQMLATTAEGRELGAVKPRRLGQVPGPGLTLQPLLPTMPPEGCGCSGSTAFGTVCHHPHTLGISSSYSLTSFYFFVLIEVKFI